MVTRAVDKLGLEWDSEPTQNQAQSKVDDRFLTSCAPAQPHKPFPFQDLHQEVSRSWKQPFPAHITNPAAADFATVSKMAVHGCAAMLVMEETLAPRFMPNSALTWTPTSKISFRTSVSCAAQSFSTRPGMLSGPAAFRGLILDRVFLTRRSVCLQPT